MSQKLERTLLNERVIMIYINFKFKLHILIMQSFSDRNSLSQKILLIFVEYVTIN